MASRDQNNKAAESLALHDKLQLLRSITNSHASANKASIVAGAAKYIKDLKEKVRVLSEGHDDGVGQASHKRIPYPPMVTVKNTFEKGFVIRVISDESCPGLLVFILGSFEDIGLTVLEARVSCTKNFQLDAIGMMEENGEIIDAEMIEEGVSKAINNWIESTTVSDEEQD